MDVGLASREVNLDSRYVDMDAPVLLSGIQALVRVLLEQARLDRAAGHRTAGLVSGYRGSPLGGLDQELWRRQKLLTAHDIRFQPGLNEDLAATMLWGTQQLDAFPGKRVDGVFGMWYGKGPGVDRSGDAFHCANMLGTAPLGGVLAVSGDDHGAHSSTYPHQTEHVFESVMMPVLQPGRCAGHHRFRPRRHRAVALLRAVDGAEDDGGDGRAAQRPRRCRAARRSSRPIIPLPPHGRSLRPRAALSRRPRGAGAARDRGAAAGGARLGTRQPARPAGLRARRRADRPGHGRQGRTPTRCTHCGCSGSTAIRSSRSTRSG